MKELLLLLCRFPFDEKNREPLSRLIKEVPDWNELVRLINAHGIIALAAYNIREAGLEHMVPEEAMKILDNGWRQNIVRNAWLIERWKEINEILCNAGINHILLKGMALEHSLYGSCGLRQMTDCDILIKNEDSIKAWQLLQTEGFSQNTVKSPLHEKMLIYTGKHLPSLSKDGFIIEIHHHLFDSDDTLRGSNIDPFVTAVEITPGETKALSLSDELQLRYLISHFNRHLLEGICQLRLYADIVLLDKTVEINIPESFIYEPGQEDRPEFRKSAYRIALKSVPKKFRFQYLLGDIFPSVRWMKQRYGCRGIRVFLYYPYRIGKLWWLRRARSVGRRARSESIKRGPVRANGF